MKTDAKPIRARTNLTLPPEPEAARGAVEHMRSGGLTNKVTRQESWQTFLRHLLGKNGLFGFLVNEIAKVHGMIPLHVERLSGQDWERIDLDDDGQAPDQESALAIATLNSITDPNGSQESLMFRLGYHFESVGECWGYWFRHPETNRVVYDIAQQPAVKFEGDRAIIDRRRNASDEQWPNRVTIPRSQMSRLWFPDPEYPASPWSTYKALVDDLKTHAVLQRAIGISGKSRLLTNGILWAKIEDAEVDANGRSWLDDYLDTAAKAYELDNPKSAAAPFTVRGRNKPEMVEMPDDGLDRLLNAEHRVLEGIARSSSLPQKLVMEGPGESNHWNEALLARSYLSFSVKPKHDELASSVTGWAFRPRLRAVGLDPMQWRVRGDIGPVANRDDNVDQIANGVRLGVLRRSCLTDALGKGEDDLIDLPDGMTEFDWWAENIASNSSQPGARPAPETVTLERDAEVSNPQLDSPEPIAAAVRRPFPAELETWTS